MNYYSQQSYSGFVASNVIPMIFIGILILFFVALWKIYTKAGQPGWLIFIPIYNTYILLKIVGRPGWWLLLYFIPYVNLAIAIVVAVDLAKSFGKSAVFAIFGLFLFPIIGYPILAFGDAKYKGPSALSKNKSSK